MVENNENEIDKKEGKVKENDEVKKPKKKKRRKKYYYKKKYKRKRGPKKKRKFKPFLYQIILVRNGKQREYVDHYHDLKSANIAFHEMIAKNNEEVIFPLQFVNTQKIKEAKDEILMIKVKDENDPNETLLRNEYGNFIPNVVKEKYDENSIYGKQQHKTWIIVDKHPWKIEETFWVFGFHPRHNRKNFSFIYQKFIREEVLVRNNLLRVLAYRNKVIFDIGSDMNIVFCKNISDALRLYGKLEEFAKEEKLKNIIWMGPVMGKQNASYWLDKLEKKTKFNRMKLQRGSLRP